MINKLILLKKNINFNRIKKMMYLPSVVYRCLFRYGLTMLLGIESIYKKRKQLISKNISVGNLKQSC